MLTRYLLILLFGLVQIGAVAQTQIGDAGHYITAYSKVHLNNPDGEPFDINLFRYQWWIGHGWNVDSLDVKVTDPNSEVVIDTRVRILDEGTAVVVPAEARGVYTAEIDSRSTLNYWYMSSSLDQSVVYTGKKEGDALRDEWFICNPIIKRKWSFFVPKGTRKFSIISQNNNGRSQREDHQITIYSPRGQRIASHFGQANWDEEELSFGRDDRRATVLDVLVEPGSEGRFWYLELGMGDSHIYSDVNIALDGIPPFLSRSPEEWFDPETGESADISFYDETQFVQSDRTEESFENFPYMHHWTPSPALGDPDGNELIPPSTVHLWNPEARELDFVIGTYLPRNMFPAKRSEEYEKPIEDYDNAIIAIVSNDREILNTTAPMLHLHGQQIWKRTLPRNSGILDVSVTEAEHFWMYTYPGTPAVVASMDNKFQFEISSARNWYFMVPEDTENFKVRTKAINDEDVTYLEVNTPDRTMAIAYGNSSELTIDVPPGMAGKIWHLRFDWGSSSRPFGQLPNPRFPAMRINLELEGVPAFISPTWEQWFDPDDPKRPMDR